MLKHLGVLTADGKINADSRRKLKQIYHLAQLIEPALKAIPTDQPIRFVDVGAGKSYLGFILMDLILKHIPNAQVWSIERDQKMVDAGKRLAAESQFPQMLFSASNIRDAINPFPEWEQATVVSALHACDTATDDAIQFALKRKAQHIVLIPCCQAEVARLLKNVEKSPISSLFDAPLHTRELGTLLTNSVRILYLRSKGYRVTVTELNGWEHSLKSEIILAERFGDETSSHAKKAAQDLSALLTNFNPLPMKLLSESE